MPNPLPGPRSTRRSRWIRFTLALTAVSLAAFAILEIGLRLIVGDVYATLYRPDARILYRLSPGQEKVFQHPKAHGGARIRVAVNRDGFRGDELLPRGAATRVVVYGDSFIAAEFSKREHSFGEQLESRLARDRGEPVEVVNAGVVGYGPDQALLRMRTELALLRPDLLILAVYSGNDFGDLLRNKLFRLDDTGELVEAAPRVVGPTAFRLRWSGYAPVLYKVVARAYYNWTHRPPQESDPDAGRKRQIDVWLKEREVEWKSARSGDLAVTNLLRDTPDVDVATAPDSESARYKRALMEGVLAAVSELSSQFGVPLLVLVVPSPMDACDGYPLAHIDPARFPDYRPERATALLSQMAEGLAIPYLDLFPAFQSHDACPLFFPADPHWNDAGQKLAAQLTADAIRQTGLLPERKPARTPSNQDAPTE